MDSALKQALTAARSYPAYRQFLQELLDKGLTTGPNQGEKYIGFAQLNQKRMDRLDKKNRLSEEVKELLGNLKRKYVLLVISEGWCGDAAQTVPIFNWVAEASPNVDLKVVLRDEHTDLMDQFLTNGGRSIPKVLFIDADSNEVLADWGPRPLVAQAIAMRHKRAPEPKKSPEEYQLELHGWYARDKTKSTQAEIKSIFEWLEKDA